MTSFIILNLEMHRFLERVPFNGEFEWLAPFEKYGTTFSKPAAEAMANKLRAKGDLVLVREDYYKREPQVKDVAEVAA